jgi:hypothetical protein
MNDLTTIGSGRDVKQYDPEKGLKTIAMAEAGERHWARAKDATKLCKAIEAKIDAQADYIVWRDSVILPPSKRGQGRTGNQIKALKSDLPMADPGDVTAHRWRKRFFSKYDGKWTLDIIKLAQAKEDAQHRAIRICEQQNMGTVRGTEGTGEFERYTPAKYIDVVRQALGEIDLDPATSEMAQVTVRATQFFTIKDDGLAHDWNGRVFLNPPYHRELCPAFIDKLLEEIRLSHVTAAILLTNNCTDTDWFNVAISVCDIFCFTHGRIRFIDDRANEVLPTQGQTFFYYGKDVEKFDKLFNEEWGGIVGWCGFISSRKTPCHG